MKLGWLSLLLESLVSKVLLLVFVKIFLENQVLMLKLRTSSLWLVGQAGNQLWPGFPIIMGDNK